MKRLFILFGVSACAWLNAGAQQNTQQPGNAYEVSVFADVRNSKPAYKQTKEVIRQLSSSFPGWYIQADPRSGSFRELNGPAIAVPGSSLEDKARYCMNNLLGNGAGINSSEWTVSGQMTNKKGFTYLYFRQEVAGQEVAFSKMHFKFTADGRLTSITGKNYGSVDTKLTATISESAALAAATADLGGLSFSKQEIVGKEWFPVPVNGSYSLRPAYRFHAEAEPANALPVKLDGYVDAISGQLLYRSNEIKDAIDLTVKGIVHKDGYTKPTSEEPLADLAITLNSDPTVYYTNAFGNMTATASPVVPDTAVIPLKGRWANVIALASSSITPTFDTVLHSLSFDYLYPTADPSSSRHVNAYYHMGRIHDHMKGYYPTFTVMDAPMNTFVDRTGRGFCNAYYTSFTINFLAAGGGCISFAEAGDVVYHEYGHGISDRFYNSISRSMRNGALNEGNSDIWGITITKNPVLGEGTTSSGGFIRRYDLSPKVYPANIVGEVHADGEIIAGAWWDLAVNLSGDVATMGELFAATYYDVPDGPNGTEGEVYFDVLMSALKNDDDDMDLSNGTPHFDEIVKAFARHGIYLLTDASVTHTETTNWVKGAPIDLEAGVTLVNPSFFQSLELVYTKRGGGTGTVVMTDAGGGRFTGTIPGQDEGTILDYYFVAKDIMNNNGKYFPDNYNPTAASTQVTLPYQFGIGMSPVTIVNFEETLPADWQIGLSSDNATAGKWTVAVPVPSVSTSGLPVQTGNDHTSGSGKCLVTGNASSPTSPATVQSVKGGLTTVITPLYDISAYSKPIVEYYRWFGNDRGSVPRKDNWQVQIASATSTIWKDVDNTLQSDYNWRRRIFHARDYINTDFIKLRFWAKEIPSGSTSSLVEAAVDDFVIYEGVEGVSVDEPQKSLAQIYPNPATDAVFVVLPNQAYKSVGIDLYDAAGKHISSVAANTATTRYQIDLKHIPAGQYMLVVRMDKTIQSRQISVLHP